MKLHRLASLPLIALAVASVVLSGCSPAPVPTPTPTPVFASEEEAFAAAEKTYRAYTDELNQVDVGEPETIDALFSLTSGDFEAADRKTFSELYAAGYELTGETKVADFRAVSADIMKGAVVAEVCVDVSQSDVVDQDGVSVTPPNRPDLNSLTVTFASSDGRLSIERAARSESSSCAVE